MKRRGMVAFSADPITYGHMDMITRAAKEVDELVVGIGVNATKLHTFTLEERREMAEKALASLSNVKVVSFRGMLVDYAYRNGIATIYFKRDNNLLFIESEEIKDGFFLFTIPANYTNIGSYSIDFNVKDTNGNYVHDAKGRKVLDHDLDEIAEEFIKFAKSQKFSF